MSSGLGLWLPAEPLVLASKSAVRRAVLEAAGIPVEAVPADIDERGIEARSAAVDPGAVAALLAREKATAVSSVTPGRWVLGADQTLALGDRRFSKPADAAAARAQLTALRGRTHALHSAVAVARDGAVRYDTVEIAHLTMRGFSDSFLDRYLQEGGSAVLASVGGYQLERIGIHLFDRVEGDHFTVLGLPLIPLLGFLRRERLVA
jgi:septum formation protein